MNRRLLALALALLPIQACTPAVTAERDAGATVAPPAEGGVALVNTRDAARLMDVHNDDLLRDAGVTGTVEAELTLNADGSVSAVRVVESTHERFSASTQHVAPRLRFTPPPAAGDQVRVRMHYIYNRNRIEVLGMVAGSRAAP